MRRLTLAVAVGLLLTGCSSPTEGPTEDEARLHPFVPSVELPEAEALWSIEIDGVSIDVYDGECAKIVEHVPDYGYLVDEFCPAQPLATSGGDRFSTPNCPVVDFGDECRDWLPTFTVGRTVAEAAFVCVASGRREVRNGWWVTVNEDGHEAFPFTASGVRLDPIENEFDDRIRERCGL